MRTLSLPLRALAVGLGIALTTAAFAASPRPHRPDVVTPEPANYVYNARWVTGVSQDGGAKGQSLQLGSTASGSFAFYAFQNWWNHTLSDVTKIRASFLTGSGTINTPGSPRISLEIENADGTQMCIGACNGFNPVAVFLDPSSCSDPAPTGGGWVESDFTADKTNCVITDNIGNTFTSDGAQSAWSKLVSSATYAGKRVWFAFLIQDATSGAGINYVDRISLDSSFFTKQP